MKNFFCFCVALLILEFGYAQIRILPLGESTTNWKIQHPMWRPKFCELLTADSVNHNMIGPYNDGATTYDGDHAGFPGNKSTDIRWNLEQFHAKQPTNIPDVIIILAGTNDCGWALPDGSTAGVSNLIDRAAELYPKAKILVSSIPPLSNSAYTTGNHIRKAGQAAANVIAFNKQLPGLCAAKAAAGKKVTFVNASAALTVESDLADGIHPNQSGNDKLAAAYFNAVKLLK
jgi:lysophospholipase L1-like esterase